MKRQGKEGFTWDSEAEEWAAWAVSCLDHNAPRSWRERRDLARFANDMLDEHDGIARPVDPYSAIQWPETKDSLEHRIFLIAGILAIGLAAAIWWMG